jgi:hypothetical protein
MANKPYMFPDGLLTQRGQMALLNGTADQVIQDFSQYDSCIVEGWGEVDATTKCRQSFVLRITKTFATSDFQLTTEIHGNENTLMSFNITSAGVLRATMLTHSGFVSASFKYTINAPATGTTLPLSVNASRVYKDGDTAAIYDNVGLAWALKAGAATYSVNQFYTQFQRSDGTSVRITPVGSTTYIDSRGLNNSTNGALAFRSSRSDDTNFFDLGTCSATGAWTLGTTTGASKTTLNANHADDALQVRNYRTTVGSSYGMTVIGGTNASDWSFRCAASDGSTVLGKCDGNGAWTFGSASGTSTELRHLFNSYRAAAADFCVGIFNRAPSDGSTFGLYISKAENTSTTAQRYIAFNYNNNALGNGQINGNGAGAAAFGAWSDGRLKENIVSLSSELSNILALNPCEFDYKTGGHQIGFIAQEIEQVYPDAVNYVGEETEEMKTVTGWDKTTARLVKAIQELSAQLDQVKAELNLLKGV